LLRAPSPRGLTHRPWADLGHRGIPSAALPAAVSLANDPDARTRGRRLFQYQERGEWNRTCGSDSTGSSSIRDEWADCASTRSSEGSDTKSVSGRKHGVRIGTTNTRKDWPHTGEAGRGLGKIQRSSAPVLLPYQPETSSKERHVGPRDQRVADTTSRQLITQRSLVQIQPPQPSTTRGQRTQQPLTPFVYRNFTQELGPAWGRTPQCTCDHHPPGARIPAPGHQGRQAHPDEVELPCQPVARRSRRRRQPLTPEPGPAEGVAVQFKRCSLMASRHAVNLEGQILAQQRTFRKASTI
jgi:hypothetical protein